jgi:hypothetical protein
MMIGWFSKSKNLDLRTHGHMPHNEWNLQGEV